MQPRFMWANKGTYGHPGGILHSGLHGIATMFVMLWIAPIQLSVAFGAIDAVAHYHIDWAKMNINKKLGWTATTHEEFWWLVGIDQWLHMMTYVTIIWWMTKC